MIVIVAGAIGRSVTGGQAWANLQYLIGLRALGHEVYYLEDTGEWSEVYQWEAEVTTWDLDYPASYIRDSLEPFGLQDNWIYRVGECSRGLSIAEFREVCSEAALLIIRGIPFITWRPEYDLPPRRAFIDIDPGFTQFRLARKEPAFVETIAKSDTLFTFGQRIGLPDCPIPTCGRRWLNTVAPIVLAHWPVAENSGAKCFTSIMRWRGLKDIDYDGVSYGQRDREFPQYLELPRLTSQAFRMALTGGGATRLSEYGWEVVPGWIPSKTTASYQTFIQGSRAEFGVAKHCYVATRGGWFSDRSVCYLASGRPVLVQDTGLSDWLPVGEGIVPFRDVAGALHGIEAINADYEHHRRAARLLAEGYFDAQQVLPPLLEAAMA
jgi:hypothetical protein